MPNNTIQAEALLTKGLKELSITFSPEQVQAFLIYLAEIKKWNKVHNLTALKTDEDIIIKHFLDSLLFLRALPDGQLSIMDVGSGAGFPGIPLKIIKPELTMYLSEPSGKKANFLRHIIRSLALAKIEVIEKRLEEIRLLSLDVAVTRALFDLKEFCKKALPLIKEEGMLILSKGPKIKEELKLIKDMPYELAALKLPLTEIIRFIIIIRKQGFKVNVPLKTERLSNAMRNDAPREHNICFNAECRMRKAGCKGFEGCPGYKGKA